MKKLLGVVLAVIFVASLAVVSPAKDEPVIPELTVEQQYTQQVQVLTQKRQQYLSAVQQIEVQIIKLQAVLEYIARQKAEAEKTEK